MLVCCTHGGDGLLQLSALYSPTVVTVEGHKGALPAVQNLAQLLELLKAHCTGHVPLTQQSVKESSHASAVTVSFTKHFTQTQSLFVHAAVRENEIIVPDVNLTKVITVR